MERRSASSVDQCLVFGGRWRYRGSIWLHSRVRSSCSEDFLMRLSRFLSLHVGMSRNQSKFFIRKGRVFVDSTPIGDPDFEVSHENCVVFDGNLVKAVDYRYFVVNKPRAYECSLQTSSAKSMYNVYMR